MKLLKQLLLEGKKQQRRGFFVNIEKATMKNKDYRRVLFTSKNNQLVVMSLKPSEQIGLETHNSAQFIRVEAGRGKVVVGEEKHVIKDGDSVVIPAGIKHNVINMSKTKHLKLYTIYSPPIHKSGLVEVDKNKSARHK